MEKHSRPLNVKEAIRKMDSNKISFDLEVQRNNVWTKTKKGKFIHSLICNFFIPPILFVDTNSDTLYVLDGRQRLNSIFEFYNDQFEIPEDSICFVDEVTGEKYDLSNKKYSDLPDVVKDVFISNNIPSYTFKNITEEEIEEMFLRQNDGEPLRKIEYIRAKAGHNIRKFLNKMSDMTFFTNTINVTKTAKNRFTDQQIILQCIAMLRDNFTLNSKSIEDMIGELKEEGISEEFTRYFEKIADYLDAAFSDEKFKYLKRVNVPIIFKLADKAMGYNVSALEFFDFVDRFFDDLPEEYEEAMNQGSASEKQVMTRWNVMSGAFENFVSELKNGEKDITEDKVKKYSYEKFGVTFNDELEVAVNT